jgi:hypothetical protein
MRIDIHCHAIGKGTDIKKTDTEIYFNPYDNQLLFTRLLYAKLEQDLVNMDADLNADQHISTDEYFSLLFTLLSKSEELDGIVLLALDAVYSPENGELDKKRTDLWVSNRFLSEKVKELNNQLKDKGSEKKFYFGASVNPNRKDWRNELEYVLHQTDAVLVKLIPSTQHIRLKDKKHRGFYKMLASGKIPLLCHVGPEYSFPEGIRKKELDYYRNLGEPLACGVSVIAAHCAAPVFPIIEKNVIQEFSVFMEAANSGSTQLWADTSALSLATRIPFIQEIVGTFPSKWLIHGSDFPIPIDSWPHLPLVTHDITPAEYIRICKTKNPFDRDVRIKRAHGFDKTIMKNAEKVLRMP